MASGTGGHQSYYVPEQSKFPFLATIGLGMAILGGGLTLNNHCLLYTSDAADERSSVDLGGRRIIKKKKNENQSRIVMNKYK